MGRKVPQPDPLRSRVSRVERDHRPNNKFPAWYYRVATPAVISGEREIYPEDFDKDLSELEEKEVETSESDCDSEDEGSEKSFEGSDAEHYYELKDERQERKRELLEERKSMERYRKYEKTKRKRGARCI